MYLTGSGTTPKSICSWSIHSRNLPWLEQSALYNAINFSWPPYDPTSSTVLPVNSTVTGASIGVLICASEINPQSFTPPFDMGFPSAVTTYGCCMGDIYIWGSFGGLPNSAAFGPNRSRTLAEFRDGSSNTLMLSEVHSHQDEQTNSSALSTLNTPGQGPGNWDPSTIGPQLLGSILPTGHICWAHGSIDQSGMTTAQTPNQKWSDSSTGGKNFDVVGIPEIQGGPTYAVVTSRSYHPGGVCSLFGDASVHFIKDTINPSIWRDLGTVNGGEIISGDAY
jgi:hypothetical protein